MMTAQMTLLTPVLTTPAVLPEAVPATPGAVPADPGAGFAALLDLFHPGFQVTDTESALSGRPRVTGVAEQPIARENLPAATR